MELKELKLEMKIDEEKVFIGHDFLNQTVSNIPDIKENKKIFNILAQSNLTYARDIVSSSDNLSKESFKILMNDAVDEIVCNLLDNNKATQYFTDEIVENILAKDNTKLNIKIAENIGEFKLCNIPKFINKLVTNVSSEVRYSLMSYSNTDFISMEQMELLSKDLDIDVSKKAKEELSDMR